MASEGNNVVLRKVTIITFPPAFILLLIHGIITNCPFPALGILPLFASAILGLFIIRRDLVAALGSPIQALSPSNVFYADLSLSTFHFIFLFISWATIRNPWDRGQIVLGTYGTVPLMIDTAIHLYLLLPVIGHMLARRSCDCPHCQSVTKSSYFASEYTPLSEGDSEAEIVETDLELGH
ncbi:uncharacterized protein LY79DRAFT_524815 [Colletotrichum navitas]|uniref:Uncharacterized protein n=1 Tax=Colletotrichum navitas TaxID=681940 RepID=A0AAD8PQK5_9PEZI|nr:uncharacterized protein LY79DRAFT_524815 [Colletotrichum navitas]KAK1573949.1 hypothetical protein LY79DRAFT_524815 [Colletotrichum navitas]